MTKNILGNQLKKRNYTIKRAYQDLVPVHIVMELFVGGELFITALTYPFTQ